jgi:hypothetical protein
MSGFRIEGSVSGNVAEVDNNNDLFVNTPTTINNTGYIAVVNEIDSGSVTGAPTRRIGYVSHDLRQRVGLDTTIFDYFFTATTQDTGVWKYTSSAGFTSTQSGGFLLLNSTQVATSALGCSLSTWRVFALEARGGLHIRLDSLLTAAPLANQVFEMGLFLPTTTTAPADGVYWRITSAGVQGIVNYNGIETSTGITDASPPISSTNTYSFEVYAGGVEWYINGVLQQILETPGGDSEPFISVSLPLSIQTRNSGTVSGSPYALIKVGSCHVDFLEIQTAMPYSHQQCAEGLTGNQTPQGGTMGNTALYAAGTTLNPTASNTLMTNTTAALGVGLGGQFTGVPVQTLGEDGILCSFLNPANTTAIPGRILMITGVRISSAVTTTLANAAAVVLSYSLAFGHTALPLTTAEGTSFAAGATTTKKPRSIALGMETYGTASAAAGTMSNAPQGIYMAFNSPIPVNPGEYVAICCRQFVTVSGVTGNFTWVVTYDAYWI